MAAIDDLNELMEAAAAGDREAFGRIVQLMTPKLAKVARYYTHQPPDDILQEVWLKIWERVSVLAGKERPEHWLYTVVRHHCYDEGRKAQSQKHGAGRVSVNSDSVRDYLEMAHGAIADYTDPENLLISKETAAFVRKYLNRLKEIYALPLYLYYFNDLSLAEIGALLDLTVSAVKWRLYTGRQLLKKEIGNHDY